MNDHFVNNDRIVIDEDGMTALGFRSWLTSQIHNELGWAGRMAAHLAYLGTGPIGGKKEWTTSAGARTRVRGSGR